MTAILKKIKRKIGFEKYEVTRSLIDVNVVCVSVFTDQR